MSESQNCLASAEPVVRLVNTFDRPLDNAVATARTCYASKVVTPEEVGATEKSRAVRDRIADETFAAGHHTTLQHATFQFTLERVSRQLVWSLLHAHPFYNSEQVSQRYVPVSMEAMTVPKFENFEGGSSSETLFRSAGLRAMKAYEVLTQMLMPKAEELWFATFPGRVSDREKHLPAIRKKAMEAARYLLPVATWTHLYHTISGLTLHRYARCVSICDVPIEAKCVVDAMVRAVSEKSPEFFRNLQDPVELSLTPEFRLMASLSGGSDASLNQVDSERALAFRREFDAGFQGTRISSLVDYSARGEETLAQSIRAVLGLTRSELDDDSALDGALSPLKNPLLAQPLKLLTMDKLSRALSNVHYAFQKKLSHTADSQDQRHRTTPATRPVLARQYALKHPDFVVPALIAAVPEAMDFYASELTALFGAIDELLERNVSPEKALYLLPNAFPIRFIESGDLMGFLHKWTTRLCLTAQEEIWHSCLDEVSDLQAVHPRIARHMGPPCTLRDAASIRPACPEGPRFCGTPVWRLGLGSIQRIL